MSTNRPGRRRLILCGICFRADCPLSQWVDEDGDLLNIIEEIQMMHIEEIHDKLESEKANKLTREEKLKEIEAEIELADDLGEPIEVINFEALLEGTSKGIEKTDEDKIVTEKDFSVDDIIKKFSETVERREDEQQKQNGH